MLTTKEIDSQDIFAQVMEKLDIIYKEVLALRQEQLQAFGNQKYRDLKAIEKVPAVAHDLKKNK